MPNPQKRVDQIDLAALPAVVAKLETAAACTSAKRHISHDELRALRPQVAWSRVKRIQDMQRPLARPVLRTDGEILKWARKEGALLGCRRPIDPIETNEGPAEAFDNIEPYIRDRLGNARDHTVSFTGS